MNFLEITVILCLDPILPLKHLGTIWLEHWLQRIVCKWRSWVAWKIERHEIFAWSIIFWRRVWN